MRPCGATLPSLRDPGWECAGVGLIIVCHARLPVVLPARALDVVEPESWWELPVQPFTGGDHMHLVVPRRPTDFRGDTLLMFGSSALSFKRVGTAFDGPSLGVSPSLGPGELFFGGPL